MSVVWCALDGGSGFLRAHIDMQEECEEGCSDDDALLELREFITVFGQPNELLGDVICG